MFIAKLILITFIIPAIISFLIQFFYKSSEKKDYKFENILGITFGCLSGYYFILGLPRLPPADLNQIIFYQFLFAGLVSSLTIFLNGYKKYLLKLFGLILLSVSAIYPLFQGLGLTRSITFSLIICSLGIIYSFIIENLINKFSELDKNTLNISRKNKLNSLVIPIVFLMISSVNSAILFMSGSALLSQLMGVITVSLIATFPVIFIKKDYSFSNSTFYFYICFHLLMIFFGYYLLDIPIFVISLVCFSPLTLLINYSKKIQSLKTSRLIVSNIISVSIPLLIALIKTIIVFSSKEAFF